jgi:hypothetical protein
MEFINRAIATKETGLSYLGVCSSSSKIKKNSKILNIDTYILYLAPHLLSGYNTCPMATTDCIKGCLNTSGRAGMKIKSNNESRIIKSRIEKTKMFYENRDFFFAWLIAEIKGAKKLSESKGNDFAVRLNGTSDLNWNVYKINGKTIFEIFPDVQFYDYTKVPSRFNNIPSNYHLTMSYTGYNWDACKTILDKEYNVAVVFNIQKWYNNRIENIVPLPKTFKGYPVIDGDVTDYRPYDEKGSIVALRFKRIADKSVQENVIKSKFVIDPNDKDCKYIVQTEKLEA